MHLNNCLLALGKRRFDLGPGRPTPPAAGGGVSLDGPRPGRASSLSCAASSARPYAATTYIVYLPGTRGREASVTHPESHPNAARGRAGAHIVKDEYQT